MPQRRRGHTSGNRRFRALRAQLQRAQLQQREQAESKADWRRSAFPMWARMLVAVAVILLLMVVFFRVDSFEVSGNVRYTAQEISEASGITVGDVLMGVNKTQAASRILVRLPYIEQVVITRILPGTVRFEVAEGSAAAEVYSQIGRCWRIDEAGKLMEELDESGDSGYPVLVGVVLPLPMAGDMAVFDDAEKGSMAMEVLSAVCDLGLQSEVQEIDVTDLDQVTVTYQNRCQVRLGDGSDLSYKLRYMVAAVEQLQGSPEGVLDLSFRAGSQAVFHPFR